MANCPELAQPSRGIITVDNQDSLKPSTFDRTPNTIVTLQCLQPNAYTLRGSTTVTCQASGQWVPSPPTCIRITSDTTDPVTIVTASDENTVILAVVGAILCTLLLAVIIILTYLLCKWWNRKSYVAKRIIYDDSMATDRARYVQPGTSFANFGKGSVFGASSEFNKSGRGHSRRSSDVSARTSSTTFTRHSMIVLPKPAYSQHYGPFWYYPIPDDQRLAGSAMRSVMDYHDDVTSVTTEPNPLYDPEVDYLQYPDEATAVDTMGRAVRSRPGVVLGSEAGAHSTKSGKRYTKARVDRHRRSEGENEAGPSELSGRSGRSGRSDEGDGNESGGHDNPALEVNPPYLDD